MDLTTPPILIEANADNILKEVISTYESFVGKSLVKGQPEYIIAASTAYSIFLAYQRMNAAGQSMLIQFSSDSVIDYIVALLGVIRIESKPATCTLRFNLVTGHGNITIYSGTRVSSSDRLAVFEVDQDTIAEIEKDTVLCNATCQVNGAFGNNYEIGSVSTIMDPQPYISTCLNVDKTQNGVDTETTEELRTRAKLATSIFSTAGPKDAYVYFVKSVSALIVDVAVITASEDSSIAPGEVHVYALLDQGNKPSDSLNSLILSTLSDEKIRPLCDTVIVSSPADLHYSLQVDAIKYKSFTGNSDDLISIITTLLNQFKTDKYLKLGLDIVCSEIETICRVTGIYDLAVTITPPAGRTLTGRNLIVNANEYAILDSFSVNIIGSNNG